MAKRSVEDTSMENKVVQKARLENTSINNGANYDVFISHRGPDTKTGFVSYLYEALKTKGLRMFVDCKSIGTSEDAWRSIENAIQNSRIAVVVFSERYSESAWCLRELEVILGTPSIKVLPIFYNVRPSEVRHPQIGALRDGFEKLRRHHDRAIIDQWKKCLREASQIMGFEHPCNTSRLEAEYLSDIVAKVLALANKPLPLHVGDYVVGVKEVAENIINFLQDKKKVWMVGLWGMGGIGKSTLARELYNQMSMRYESTCYIEDVADMVHGGGVKRIQEKIMKDLCKNNSEDIDNKFKGKTILKERLCKIRFLLVLDNVQENDSTEELLSKEMFEASSLCIVTARNRKLFEIASLIDDEEEVYIHDVEGLSTSNSEKLFKSFARGGSSIINPKLVSSIIKRCSGVPLVLKVTGALLGKSRDESIWEEVMETLEKGTIMDEKKIFDCLRLSYDALKEEEKEMFLDIACTLIGERKDLALRVWKALRWFANIGIQSLIEKALITVDDNGRFKMHDHLRDMGRAIEKKNVPRIRMWMGDDLVLLHKSKGLPDSLQVLNLSSSFEGHINDLDVSDMKDLRILLCDGVLRILPTLPRSIIWFRGNYLHGDVSIRNNENCLQDIFEIGIGYLPNRVEELNNLKIMEFTWNVTLELHQMVHTRIVHLPHTFGELRNLELLNLSGCPKLTMLPDSFGRLKMMRELELCNSGISGLPHTFGGMSNLESLDLSGCKNLNMLPDSFGRLKMMCELDLSNARIRCLPETFGELSSLEVLDLHGCINLTMLPDSFGRLKMMSELDLSDTRISNLPKTFGELSNLELLDLRRCKNLTMLPDSFGRLKMMRELNLCDSEISDLPQTFGGLSCLESLDLSGCKNLTMLPYSFGELSTLEVLDLHGCINLTILPDSFGRLKMMRELDLSDARFRGLPHTFGELSSLEVLNLSRCNCLTSLPNSFGRLKMMRKLKLWSTSMSSLPETFGDLSSLEVLHLTMLPDSFGCKNFINLPDSFGSLKMMRELKLTGLNITHLPKTFGELSNLEVLKLVGCENLKLPYTYEHDLYFQGPGVRDLLERYRKLNDPKNIYYQFWL